MQHPDEGTIHAWLDGALPPAEASALEAHVASCAECSAAVAEARGMLAAASRILSALDDVPGGVIPAAAPADATRVAPGRASAAEVRPFRFRAARWQVAAGLMIAVAGSWLVMRKADERGMIEIKSEDMSVAAQASVTFAPDTLAVEPQAEAGPQPAPAARAGAGATERVAARAPSPSAPRAARGPSSTPPRVADAPVALRGVEIASGNTAAKSILGYGQGGAGALASSLPARTLDSLLAMDSAATARQEMRLESTVVVEERALSGSAQRARAPSPAPASPPAATGGVAADADRRLAQTGVPDHVLRLAGCYVVSVGPWSGTADSAGRALIPGRLQLSSEWVPGTPNAVSFVARAVPGDPAFASATSVSWTLLGPDQLRVRFGGAGRVAVMTLATAPDALRGRVRVMAGDVSTAVAGITARRIACPAPPER